MLISQRKINVFIYKDFLFFAEDLGIIVIDISYALNKMKLYYDKGLLRIKIVDNGFTSTIVKHKLLYKVRVGLDNLYGLSKQKLLLLGIGFRCWASTKRFNRGFVIFKIGFSKDICFIIPSYLKVICLKPILFIVKSYYKAKLSEFAVSLHSVRRLNIYKNRGIFLSKADQT